MEDVDDFRSRFLFQQRARVVEKSVKSVWYWGYNVEFKVNKNR